MKKLLFILAAAVCCFALAAPAMAQVKISGMITLDAFYFDQDAERYNALLQNNVQGFTDRGTTRIGLPQALNRFDVQWTSEDKKVHGRIQLRYGAPTGDNFGNAPAQGFDPEFAYIDYHWTSMWYSRFGRQEQTFAIMAPSQSLGQMNGHIVGAGWGNVHGGTARDGIKNFFKFSDMVRLEVELIDPSNDSNEIVRGDTTATATPAGLAAVGIYENSVIPRIDAALNIKVANFVIEPSVTWLRQEYDWGSGVQNLINAAGVTVEDSMDIWGAALGVAAGFGPFSARGEVTIGQNLGNANYVGGNGVAMIYQDTNGNIKMVDTDVFAWWIDLAFDFGPAAIHGIVGYEKWESDAFNDNNVAGLRGEFERERWAYGVNLPIKMTKNFTIKPEIMFYDDDDEGLTGRTDGLWRDFGSEMVAGVQFQLVF